MCLWRRKGAWKTRNDILILILIQKTPPTVLKPNWYLTYESKRSRKCPDPKIFWRRYSAFRRTTCLIRSVTFIPFIFSKERIIDMIFEKNLRKHSVPFPSVSERWGNWNPGIKWLSKLNTTTRYPKKSNLKWDINVLVQVKPNIFIIFAKDC